jgi:quercetin dioxygenase-like cupin family protein
MILEKSWGLIKEYTLNQVCTVKVIVISAGHSTSLHYHRLRDDMWIILDGGLEVQVGDKTYHPREGDEFVIKAGTEHKIVARDTPGRVLEIDFGFTAEDDVGYLEQDSSGESD